MDSNFMNLHKDFNHIYFFNNLKIIDFHLFIYSKKVGLYIFKINNKNPLKPEQGVYMQ